MYVDFLIYNPKQLWPSIILLLLVFSWNQAKDHNSLRWHTPVFRTNMALEDVKSKLTNYLTEAVVEICKSGLSYRTQFSVEGLLGVTLDEDKVILININETVKNRFAGLLGSARWGEVFLNWRYLEWWSWGKCLKLLVVITSFCEHTVNQLNFATALISRISRSHIN